MTTPGRAAGIAAVVAAVLGSASEADPLARWRCAWCGHLDAQHTAAHGCAADDCGCRRFTRALEEES